MTKDEAERRRWTFYEAVKVQFLKIPYHVVQLNLNGPFIHLHDSVIPVPPLHVLLQKITITSETADTH